MISFWQKIEKLSALSLDADITMIFLSGSLNNTHNTKAAVIQDLPTPLKALICNRFGPCCKYSAIANCALVGLGRLSSCHTNERKTLKSSLILASKVASCSFNDAVVIF